MVQPLKLMLAFLRGRSNRVSARTTRPDVERIASGVLSDFKCADYFDTPPEDEFVAPSIQDILDELRRQSDEDFDA